MSLWLVVACIGCLLLVFSVVGLIFERVAVSVASALCRYFVLFLVD